MGGADVAMGTAPVGAYRADAARADCEVRTIWRQMIISRGDEGVKSGEKEGCWLLVAGEVREKGFDGAATVVEDEAVGGRKLGHGAAEGGRKKSGS